MIFTFKLIFFSKFEVVRTDLANRPTEPMLVFYVSRCTKLSCNNGFLQSGPGQATPVRVGVTCGSGISVVQVGGIKGAEVTRFGTRERGDAFSESDQKGTREARG